MGFQRIGDGPEFAAAALRCRAVDAYEALVSRRGARRGAREGYQYSDEAHLEASYAQARAAFEANRTPLQAELLRNDLDSIDDEFGPC